MNFSEYYIKEGYTMRTSGNEITQGNIADYVKYLVNQARNSAPKSVFNKATVILHTVFGLLFSPLVLLQGISTLVLGCLVSITFGILLFIMNVIWWPLLGFMLVSSWLWYHVGFSRILLLVPGVFIAEFASAYAGLMPSMGEWDSRATKLAICESWPHSMSIFRGQIR